MFPGSKFILTVRRSEKEWLESICRHSMKTSPFWHCRRLAYGYNYPAGREKEHLEIYRRHNDSVRSYFKGREKDFIEVCWEWGDGWKELCVFLHKEIPSVPFPHANRSSLNCKHNVFTVSEKFIPYTKLFLNKKEPRLICNRASYSKPGSKSNFRRKLPYAALHGCTGKSGS